MQMHVDRRWDSRISQPEAARRFAEGPAENPAEVRGVGARAFAAHPTILLIDEMSLGLAPGVFLRLLPIVEHIAATGVGVLLVEQFTHLGQPQPAVRPVPIAVHR